VTSIYDEDQQEFWQDTRTFFKSYNPNALTVHTLKILRVYSYIHQCQCYFVYVSCTVVYLASAHSSTRRDIISL